MRWFLIFRLGLRSLFRGAAVDRELEEELRFHIDREVQQNLAARMTPEEAHRAALRQFGNLTQQMEECRDARSTRMIRDFFEDVCYAIRSLRRDPFLVLTATLTLATCIGTNTAVFSLANSILIRPLPYPNSERIYWISERSGPNQEDNGAAPDYYYLRRESRIFEDVAAFSTITVNWTGVETPEQLDAAQVSASFFTVMGMKPMLGRYLAPDEEGTKAPAVAVVSYAFWRSRLGSDPHILGKNIALDRRQRVIVGVMPQGFDFPRGSQVWLPSSLDESSESFPISPTRPIFTVSILARLRPEVTKRQAETEISRLTAAIRAQYKVFQATGFRSDLNIDGVPLQRRLTGDLRPALLALTGAAGLVLLIACVNLASLLLARAGCRQREFAIRLALGSGRSRIVRQMLTGSLALALPGGVAGIGFAWIAIRMLNGIQPAILVRYPAISMDLRVLAFTIALTVATSLLFGLTPALSASGTHIQEALRTSGLAHSRGPGAARLRKALVVSELGLSLVLLIGAGLLARSLFRLAHTELGFSSVHLLTFRVNPIGPLDRNYARFYEDVLNRLQRIPLARSAALVADMPLNSEDFYWTGRIRVMGRTPLPFAARPIINNSLVSPEFLQTLQVPLKSGRFFEVYDSARPEHVVAPGFVASEPVVVNEAFVRRIFPGENPIGRSLVFGPDQHNITWTIVGVVGDVRGGALGADVPSMVYRCTCSGNPVFRAGFIIRTAGDPKAVVRSVEEQVRAVDRDQPIFDVKTMEERREAALAPERFELALAGAFAIIAILLAAAGIYGVMSYLITHRTREIGIRVAMGARPADVLRMVIGETSILVLLATALGLGSAWALTRFIRSMLYGVSELDPVTFLVMPVLLALVVLIAALGPSLRAVHVDPMTALREE
jgi:putative ABC transport system permease protein